MEKWLVVLAHTTEQCPMVRRIFTRMSISVGRWLRQLSAAYGESFSENVIQTIHLVIQRANRLTPQPK